MKKIGLLLICCFLMVGLCSCDMGGGSSKGLDTPANVSIEGTILHFDEVDGAEKYRAEIVNKADETNVIKRYVTDGIDLNTLNIPEGEYIIRVQAVLADLTSESGFSTEVIYKQKDLYMVQNIKEEALVDGNFIKWMGRTSYSETTKANTMYYSASGFEVKVKKLDEALTLTAKITATEYANADKRPYIVLVKDGDFENTITLSLTKAETEVVLIGEGGFEISDSEEHTIALYKRSESIDSHVALKELNTTGKFISGVTYKERKIEVIAASSSTGYGNLGNASSGKNTGNSDALHAFAFLSSLALNSEINIVSASGWGISASRWTSPNTLNMADKYKYVDVFSSELWDTSNYIPDVIITNFGTNDLSYINAATTQTEKDKRTELFITTYVNFLDYLHKTYPNAKIIVIYGLMLESGIYDQTVEMYNEAKKLIPDLELLKLQGDAQGYNSHPSAASHQIIANNLVEKIKEVTGWE